MKHKPLIILSVFIISGFLWSYKGEDREKSEVKRDSDRTEVQKLNVDNKAKKNPGEFDKTKRIGKNSQNRRKNKKNIGSPIIPVEIDVNSPSYDPYKELKDVVKQRQEKRRALGQNSIRKKSAYFEKLSKQLEEIQKQQENAENLGLDEKKNLEQDKAALEAALEDELEENQEIEIPQLESIEEPLPEGLPEDAIDELKLIEELERQNLDPDVQDAVELLRDELETR